MSNIKVYQNTKIYIVAPASSATGGPELLHQLCHCLRYELGFNSFMYYTGVRCVDPVHPEYKCYKNIVVDEIDDTESNILIVPEIPSGVKTASRFRNIRKVLWWLSVDNYYKGLFFYYKRHLFFHRILNKISIFFLEKEFFDLNKIYENKICIKQEIVKKNNVLKNFDYNFAQSYYALSYLKGQNVDENKIFYLSDFLNKKFLRIKTNKLRKENIVAYNPKKGIDFTRKLISKGLGLEFIALSNMSRDEVIDVLRHAKVYIEFGAHPGKDRIPREAAILNCCLFLGRNGSADFYDDVPVNDKYKFDCTDENVALILDRIKFCFENYECMNADFDHYRNIIKNEYGLFLKNIYDIFERV